MALKRYYSIEQGRPSLAPNIWDVIVLVLLFAILALLAWGTQGIARPYALGDPLPISLDPACLPQYAIRTVVRMGLALMASLIFSLLVGAWAAKNERAEKWIMPVIDILQSVPILGFLSFTLVWFVHLFPNSLLGPECAAVFVIFTSQAWNITIGFYQSLKTVPAELREVGKVFQLSAWKIFWRIEVPHALPSLLWNIMVSFSAGWFFIIVSEAISVANHDISLPGIGSYIAKAIQEANPRAIGYAIFTMFVVILIYDQLLFKPLVKWSERFQTTEDEASDQPLILLLLKRTRWVQRIGNVFSALFHVWINLKFPFKQAKILFPQINLDTQYKRLYILYQICMGLVLFLSALLLGKLLINAIPHPQNAISTDLILHLLKLGLFTLIRIVILIVICSLIWVPIGVWIGLRPHIAHFAQPIAQFLAAIPANLFYPLAVILIIHFDLNVEIWVGPLMILGTQWYILFNVIAGASQLPKELQQAVENLGVKGWLWWKRLALPAIFPYYVTGAMTAAGGAWNSSIVAEVVQWGSVTLKATGLGAYITDATREGHFLNLSLGIFIMCFIVTVINRLFWKPLFEFSCSRFHFDT